MFKVYDWECFRCLKVQEFVTREGRPPETPCSCGSDRWVRKYPGPATTFKHAGRFISKAKPVSSR